MTEEIQETYPDAEEGSYHLIAEERETIISWNDEDRAANDKETTLEI